MSANIINHMTYIRSPILDSAVAIYISNRKNMSGIHMYMCSKHRESHYHGKSPIIANKSAQWALSTINQLVQMEMALVKYGSSGQVSRSYSVCITMRISDKQYCECY